MTLPGQRPDAANTTCEVSAPLINAAVVKLGGVFDSYNVSAAVVNLDREFGALDVSTCGANARATTSELAEVDFQLQGLGEAGTSRNVAQAEAVFQFVGFSIVASYASSMVKQSLFRRKKGVHVKLSAKRTQKKTKKKRKRKGGKKTRKRRKRVKKRKKKNNDSSLVSGFSTRTKIFLPGIVLLVLLTLFSSCVFGSEDVVAVQGEANGPGDIFRDSPIERSSGLFGGLRKVRAAESLFWIIS